MRSVQDILLQHEIPNKISKSYVHKRWSQECGEEAVLELRTLSYDRVEEIKELHQKETSVYIVLEGVVAPDFRSKELREKNVMPGHFYRMPPGEKQLIGAFCEQECNGGQV